MHRLGLALLLIASAGSAPAWADEPRQAGLERVWCVDVAVGTFVAPLALDITGEAVRDAVEVALRARIPKLSIMVTCPDALRVLLVLATSSPTVFYGVADLTVLRQAIIVETGEFSRAEAWRSTFVLHGPVADTRRHLVDVIETMIDRFAREREAGGDR
jgi:hypothetical protein